MKSSNREKAEGKIHQVKGKFKEAAGIIAGNRDLEAVGKEEKKEGKIQEKLGQIKKLMDK
ncbi:CsbD family protein [Desulfosudis oleivorans Hxd3]|uniref:CsbD family protein n=2 Tax=Desulfosudis TaxID=2904716 RepID=A8ZV30_DESOH|nr:CsbD family protein [Desulfosudis oleivorans Hxd3]